MTRASTLRVLGFVAIALAVIGSVMSYSVVRTGDTDGVVYVIVNIALIVIGVVLLLLAARKGSGRDAAFRASSETPDDTTPPTE